MLYSQRNPLKTRQVDITNLYITISGDAAAPTFGGIDKAIVKSIARVSKGVFKITLRSTARRPLFMVGVAPITEDAVINVVASDNESITVKCKIGAVLEDDTDANLTIGYHGYTTLF